MLELARCDRDDGELTRVDAADVLRMLVVVISIAWWVESNEKDQELAVYDLWLPVDGL